RVFPRHFGGKVDPAHGMAIGVRLLCASRFLVAGLDLNFSMTTLALNSVLQGVGIGIFWVPLTLATFPTMESRLMPDGMALFHLLRNIGSSFFISLCVAEIVRAQSGNYSRLTEMISPYNRATDLPWVMGAWTMDTQQGLARLAREANRQAAMIGYLNAFGTFTATAAGAILVVLVAKQRQRKA